MEEIGKSFPKLGGFIDLLVYLGFEQRVPVPKITVTELKEKVKQNFDEPFLNDEIDATIKFLSLWNRKKVDYIPKGFISNDVSPWRYNRRLSYLQSPLILVDYGTDKDNPKIYRTPRHVHYVWRFLNGLISSGRYKAPEKSKLESKISKIAQENRVELQRQAFLWFQENSEGIIAQEVGIGPKGKLKHHNDIGDIDILLIDIRNKSFFLLNAKKLNRPEIVKK